MRVFLAHASEQQKECEKIVTKLRARGLKVFYSADTIPPSEDFDHLIRSEITRCDAMIFLLSPQSVAEGCYALTELHMASERWPNPRRRILAVVAADVPLNLIPPYLRDNIELFKPSGDIATETANAMMAIRRVRLRAVWLKAIAVSLTLFAAISAFVWNAQLTAQARLKAVSNALLDSAKRAPVYLDTCVTKLDRFSMYNHQFTLPERACNPLPVLESLSLPALVVSQTGYGKKGFLQSLRGELARKARPSVLVSFRDCVRGRSRGEQVEITACLVEKVRKEAHVSASDATTWLRDPKRYVLMFDALDDSASREQIFHLIQSLWQHQQDGGTVVLSSQPENLKYVLARYGLENWVNWIRDDLPTVVVRGININSVKRIATDYEEHRVPPEDVAAVLDFPQKCPDAAAVMNEWISQPKLFRERGTLTVSPVVNAIRALGPKDCHRWRSTVLAAMLSARLWSYCHDELCNYKTDGIRYVKVAQQLRNKHTVGEAELAKIAKDEGFGDVDEVAFPLLSTGVLFFDGGEIHVDPNWIPE